MRAGVHGPNSNFKPADYSMVALACARSVKIFRGGGTMHSAGEVAALRSMGVTHFVGRLPVSVWRKPDDTEYIPYYTDYGDACVEEILWGVHQGIFDWIFDNEPNVTWGNPLYGGRGLTGGDYRAFFADTLSHVKSRLIEIQKQQPDLPLYKVRLGFPPYSFGDEFAPYDWLEPMKQLAQECDFVTVHSYWQSDRLQRGDILRGPLTWQQFGANYEWYHEHFCPNKPLVIGEWANSIHEKRDEQTGQLVFTPAQVEAFRVAQYPIWLERVTAQPYIEGAYLYISPGATARWAGYAITESVAKAIAPFSGAGTTTGAVGTGQSSRVGFSQWQI